MTPPKRLSELNDDEKRALIAEACGQHVYKFCGELDSDHDGYVDEAATYQWNLPFHRCHRCDGYKWVGPLWYPSEKSKECPDYLHSLDAMALAEKVLFSMGDYHQARYRNALWITPHPNFAGDADLHEEWGFATATQRADAFLVVAELAIWEHQKLATPYRTIGSATP